MGEKILIVDDDESICEILEFNLLSEGYTIEIAHSAEEGLKKLNKDFHLILLDVMMGGISGYKMANQLRKKENKIPIIFLTAKETENDMLTGFSVGGDDYISKPFSIKEVVARVKAVLSRTKSSTLLSQETSSKIELGDIHIDEVSKEVSIEGEIIRLTKTEFEILVILCKNTNKTFSRQDIMDKVWGESAFVTDRTVDVHIARLRKKMKSYGAIISNRPGFGYRLDKTKL